MKVLPTIFLAVLFSACTRLSEQTPEKDEFVIQFESGYSLYQDTVFVNIKGEMTHALKYRNKLYVIFEQRVFKYGGHGKRWLYIFTEGNIEKLIELPKELKTNYLDFYVKNDTIIVKPDYKPQSYYLDLKRNVWVEHEETDNLIFEDDKFYVYSTDFGELGGMTWFKDKTTGSEYAVKAFIPLVNKINTTYYLTSPFRVLKIEDPILLNKCNDDVTYRNIGKSGQYYYWHPEPVGIEVIYEDTTADYYSRSYNPHIHSSFVLMQKELLHIVTVDNAVYIAKIENNAIVPIQKIAENLRYYNEHFSYRCRNAIGRNELLKFRTDDDRFFGLMEINNYMIHMTHFSNSAELEPKSIGSEKADNIFMGRLNIILSDLEKLKIEHIDVKEQQWGTFDITPNHRIGISEFYYPNPNGFELDTSRSYLIQEDSVISNLVRYYATRGNGLIRVVSIDWEQTDIRVRSPKTLVSEALNKKARSIEHLINQATGEKSSKQERKNFTRKIWNTSDGFTIGLDVWNNNMTLRLVIYKN